MSINSSMKNYNYYLTGILDGYGQPTISSTPDGQIEMAINLISQSISDSMLYSTAEYIGLTKAAINDSYIIDFNGVNLKVLYVNSFGRLNQVMMERMK